MISQVPTNESDGYGVWKRPRSESSVDADSVYMTNNVLSDPGFTHPSRRSSVSVFIRFYIFYKYYQSILIILMYGIYLYALIIYILYFAKSF